MSSSVKTNVFPYQGNSQQLLNIETVVFLCSAICREREIEGESEVTCIPVMGAIKYETLKHLQKHMEAFVVHTYAVTPELVITLHVKHFITPLCHAVLSPPISSFSSVDLHQIKQAVNHSC